MKINDSLNKKSNVFAHTDYKSYLKAIIDSSEIPKIKSVLAAAMGVPNSFLSQILHTHIQLSLDHGFKLSKFLNLRDKEREYFLQLINLARAGSVELRTYLEGELERLKTEDLALSKRLSRPELSEDAARWNYYGVWYYAVVHLLTMIPKYQDVESISKELKIPMGEVIRVLKFLEAHHLVRQQAKNKWVAGEQTLHLPKGSSISNLNHAIWRHKTAERILSQPNPRDLHFSSVHVLSREDFKKIHREFIDKLEELHRDIRTSKEETLACLSLDFFQLVT